MEKLAQTLLEKETISAAEVDVLLGRVQAETPTEDANDDTAAEAVAATDTPAEATEAKAEVQVAESSDTAAEQGSMA